MVKEMHGLLPELEDSQTEATCTLLSTCLVFSKLTIAFQICPPASTEYRIVSFDLAIFDAVLSVLGDCLSLWSWLKSPLLVLLGGLGV